MSHLWSQNIQITPVLAQQLIQKQTDLTVDSIKHYAEGWDNIAYLVNDQWIFRFPRRDFGIECMEHEIEVLPYLAKHLSFHASFPHYIGQSSPSYSAPFAGYRRLAGTPLSEHKAELIKGVSFARILAHWLQQLHGVPVNPQHQNKLSGKHSWRYSITLRYERSAQSLERYERYFIESGFKIAQLQQCVAHLPRLSLDFVAKNKYVHGDLYSRHLLVNEQSSLQGIIDWGDIHIGNPGFDLAIGIMLLDSEALEAFYSAYRPLDVDMLRVAAVRAFVHPIILLPYCYEKNDETLKQWTIIALQRGIANLELFL